MRFVESKRCIFILCFHFQMTLVNDANFTSPYAEFSINRNKNAEITSVISKEGCSTICSRSVAITADLDVGDVIYVTSATPDARFVMSCDKARFGVSLLSRH